MEISRKKEIVVVVSKVRNHHTHIGNFLLANLRYNYFLVDGITIDILVNSLFNILIDGQHGNL